MAQRPEEITNLLQDALHTQQEVAINTIDRHRLKGPASLTSRLQPLSLITNAASLPLKLGGSQTNPGICN